MHVSKQECFIAKFNNFESGNVNCRAIRGL